MTKTYVLDTSVLLNTGKAALYGFEEHKVVIPLGVIRQLESSSQEGEFQWIAASVLRELEKLRTESSENINEGITLPSGGSLRIELNHVQRTDTLPHSARSANNTLLVAHNLISDGLDKDEVVLVSNDLTQRLVASALSIQAEPFRRKSFQGEYTGVDTIHVNDAQMSRLYRDGSIEVRDVPEADQDKYPVRHAFIMKNLSSNGSALVVKSPNGMLELIRDSDYENMKVHGRSAEQKIAMAHLMNPDVDIVSLGGPAGTGKTLLALAAGQHLVENKGNQERRFKKVVVFRPLQEVGGQELGFLPGTEDEKMLPWTQAIKDAMSVWMDPQQIAREFALGKIEVSPATFIRGRTINDAFIIIDEAQNFERLTLLSILSRLGQNSKCVLSWDAAQRDNLYINKDDGVVAIIDRMKNEPLVAHVTLTKTERSRAARMATEILDEMNL